MRETQRLRVTRERLIAQNKPQTQNVQEALAPGSPYGKELQRRKEVAAAAKTRPRFTGSSK